MQKGKTVNKGISYEQLVLLATQKAFTRYIPKGLGEEYEVNNLVRAADKFARRYLKELQHLRDTIETKDQSICPHNNKWWECTHQECIDEMIKAESEAYCPHGFLTGCPICK